MLHVADAIEAWDRFWEARHRAAPPVAPVRAAASKQSTTPTRLIHSTFFISMVCCLVVLVVAVLYNTKTESVKPLKVVELYKNKGDVLISVGRVPHQVGLRGGPKGGPERGPGHKEKAAGQQESKGPQKRGHCNCATRRRNWWQEWRDAQQQQDERAAANKRPSWMSSRRVSNKL